MNLALTWIRYVCRLILRLFTPALIARASQHLADLVASSVAARWMRIGLYRPQLVACLAVVFSFLLTCLRDLVSCASTFA